MTFYIHKSTLSATPNVDYEFIRNILVFEGRYIEKFDTSASIASISSQLIRLKVASLFKSIDQEWLLSEAIKDNIIGKTNISIDILADRQLIDIELEKIVSYEEAVDTLFGFHE